MKWDHSLINTLEWGNKISHKEDKIKIPRMAILDIWMDYIPENTESTLKSITGVLESGLFMNYKVEVLGLTS